MAFDESKRRIVRVPISQLKIDPELKPTTDAKFIELLKDAVNGTVPVNFARVPLAICVPFDLDYRPDLHPITSSAIRQIGEQVRQGHAPTVFVYPRGKWFVVADDYIPLFAALEVRQEYVPCWILGTIQNTLVRDIQGPLNPEDFRTRVLGWS